jgi:uncharacterized LabA/DUF88 family protein
MARTIDPSARVLVFIDGQNAYKACRRLYGSGPCHPLLLAERVAQGRRLVGVRFYSGVHDPTVDPKGRSYTDRRHNLVRRTGVTVVERKLRYRTEWGFDPDSLPDARKSLGQTIKTSVTPYERAREKGIDLAIGLDVVDLALNGHMEVAVIVSSDNDLCEAARATHEATRARGRTSVEGALFTDSRRPILLGHYDFTHQLRRADFDAARDSFDYHNPLPQAMADLFVNSCATLRAGLQIGGG